MRNSERSVKRKSSMLHKNFYGNIYIINVGAIKRVSLGMRKKREKKEKERTCESCFTHPF